MRQLVFFVTLVIIVSISQPCMAQLDEVYDIPLSVHSPDDEWPPWPHIAVDDSGYVYVTCRVDWAIETRKLDSIGNTVWTQTICNGLACTPHDIELDANANVYVLGTMDYVFNDTIMGDCNLVLMKYDSSGVHQWTATYPFTTDIHYPDFIPFLGTAEPDAISGQLEVSPNGQSYVWGNRWDRYFDGVHVNRQKNGFLLIYDHTGAEVTNQSFQCPIDHPSRPGVPGDRVEGVHTIDLQGNVSIVASTWADLEICPYNPTDFDTAYQDAFWLYEAEDDGSPLYEEQHFRDNILWEPCMFWGDGTRGVEIYCDANDISTDFAGNKYVFGSIDYWYNNEHLYHGFINKFDPGWHQIWSYDLNKAPYAQYPLYSEIDADSAGNVVIVRYYAEDGQRVIRLDPNGNLVGVDGYSAGVARIDDAANTYVGFNGIRKYDADFNTVWSRWWGTNIHVNEMEVDRKGNIYLAYINWEVVGAVGKLEQIATLVVRDAHNDTIPNVEFELIKVSNDPPDYTEDTLGTFTTNDMGQLKLRMVRTDSLLFATGPGNDTPDTLAIGDTLKVSKHVHSQPAIKHPGLLSTAYSVHLDNGEFDPDGVLSFDTLELGVFDVVLDHTEIRHNLVASVEWEASFAYLDALEENFRHMSNYLYDVSDGQMRLDTVMIYDHREQWDGADMRIHATNNIRASAYLGGMYSAINDWAIYMPRKAFFSDVDRRNNTDINPLPMVDVSGDYRTKAHEFGHYALSFYDEYMLFDGTNYVDDQNLRCLAFPLSNYGFMDHQFEQFGEKSSEMSSAYRYEFDPCQNTMQWGYNHSSCWDQFEAAFEDIWGVDNVYAPILKPDASDETEHHHLTVSNIFSGPNNDIHNLDYDVGQQITFPVAPQPQGQDFSNVHIKIVGTYFPENAVVELVNNPLTMSEQIINQGAASDAGQMWILGVYDPTYWILTSIGRVEELYTRSMSSDQYRKIWQYGIAQQNGSVDSLEISMKEVHGYYPLICEATLLPDSVLFAFAAEQMFSEDPSMTLYPDGQISSSHDLTAGTNSYSASIGDSLSYSGSMITWAVDDSSAQFFFPMDYRIFEPDYSEPIIDFNGPSNQSRYLIDTLNEGIEKIMVLSSPYSVIRTGLDPNAVQAGETHCLSVYPDREINFSRVAIRYDDVDLRVGDLNIGDESTLEIYRWVNNAVGWQPAGGSVVDTARNEVWAPMPIVGTYAAFTTNIITDVEDYEYGDILPYRFELSQNYPNPFNPVTTIEYNLPRRSSVKIEVFNLLGQKVRTLVDREEPAGTYSIAWDGTSSTGEAVSTGVYFYRFQADDHVETRKMLLLK